jgi:hypothetical protein
MVIYQNEVTVHRSVIDPTTAVPTPSIGLDAYIAARAVCYDRSQSLTSGQQAQARQLVSGAAQHSLGEAPSLRFILCVVSRRRESSARQ